ncbi:MAG: LLM class flavin-dependent oxidoreductase [bacterium]
MYSPAETQFGLAVPGELWRLPMAAKQTLASQIYNSGYHHVFMADHVSFRNGSGTDGFVEVAALSQLHDQLGVMISIYLLPLRHPLPVARALVTMAKLAPGRMTFGVGVGGEDRHEIEVCGVDPRTRGKRTNESLEIIRRLLAGEEVDYAGDHFSVEQARIRPTPQLPIPFIIGGRSNAALRRTARYGEGWIGVWCSQRRYAQAVDLIQNEADACGRGDTRWLHGYQPWVGVDNNSATAKKAVAQQMEAFYKVPFEKFERYTPAGTPTEVAEQLAGYSAAGARMFNLKICCEHPAEEVHYAGEVQRALTKLIA